MVTLSELTNLFAELAATLRRSTAAGDFCDNETSKSISSLVASLNSQNPNSRVRVLDAALSLMCFKTPQIVSARIDCLVGTIVSVLSSMVRCDLEMGRCGSSISVGDCPELIRIGAHLVQNLEENYGSSSETIQTLLHVILKAAVSLSNCQIFVPSTSINDEENERIKAAMRTDLAKFIHFLPDKASDTCDEIPLRSILWYLDPLILKQDISEILRESTERPFLCLKKELHARKSWRSIIVNLVQSPTMFLKTRALIHRWFTLTGLTYVLNLQIALTSSVLDVLSRPMRWGVSMEMGSKFPFFHAYFPKKHRELLYILSGPISCESFLELVHHIQTAAISPSKFSNQNDIHTSCANFGHGSAANAIDSNSTWSMLMDFPAWFYFAIILIFHGRDSQDSFLSRAIFSACEADRRNVKDIHKAAAFYVSWVLDPLDENSFHLLAHRIQESSRSWSMKSRENFIKEQSYSDTHEKKTQTRRRKLRVSEVNNCEKLQLAATDDIASAVEAWLQEFHGSCVDVCSRVVSSQVSTEAKNKHGANVQPNPLLLRIPLGILITSGNMEERGYELLLHYATTGEILQSRERPKSILCHLGCDPSLWFGGNGSKWPIDGACVAFNLFDILKDMSVMLFVCEDTRASFICQMKDKISGYLLSCINALLELSSEQFQIDEVMERAMVDLYRRLTEWIQKGQEVFEGYKAFSEVVDDFARRFTIGKENQDI